MSGVDAWFARLTPAEQQQHLRELAEYETWREEDNMVSHIRTMSNPPERLATIRAPDEQEFELSEDEEWDRAQALLRQAPMPAYEGGGAGLTAAAASAPSPVVLAKPGKSRYNCRYHRQIQFLQEKQGGVTLLPPCFSYGGIL